MYQIIFVDSAFNTVRKVGSIQSNERLLARHPVIVQKLKKGLTIKEIASITGKSTATIMKVKKILEA